MTMLKDGKRIIPKAKPDKKEEPKTPKKESNGHSSK